MDFATFFTTKIKIQASWLVLIKKEVKWGSSEEKIPWGRIGSLDSVEKKNLGFRERRFLVFISVPCCAGCLSSTGRWFSKLKYPLMSQILFGKKGMFFRQLPKSSFVSANFSQLGSKRSVKESQSPQMGTVKALGF